MPSVMSFKMRRVASANILHLQKIRQDDFHMMGQMHTDSINPSCSLKHVARQRS